jgi:hypothetical protein
LAGCCGLVDRNWQKQQPKNQCGTAMDLREICQCSWIGFLTFCLIKWWSAVTGLPDHSWSFASKFLPLSLDFLTKQHSSYVHSICTITGQSFPVNSEQFHSWASKTRQLFTVWCTSTHWKWTTHYEHNMAHPMANWSSKNKEQVGTCSASRPHRLCKISSQRHYIPTPPLPPVFNQ